MIFFFSNQMMFQFVGHIDHAARVMRVITWNRSFRGVPNGDAAIDDPDAEEYETHATVLDKLLAWEKKLYEEVKVHHLILPVSILFIALSFSSQFVAIKLLLISKEMKRILSSVSF